MSRTVPPEAVGNGLFTLPLGGTFTLKCDERLDEDENQQQYPGSPNRHDVTLTPVAEVDWQVFLSSCT
jgi:hypothetical protein